VGKYFVRADPPDFVGRSQYKSLGLSGPAIRLLFSQFSGTFNKYRIALRERGAVMLENGDAVGDELRNGMVLFLHIPPGEEDRLVKVLWRGDVHAPRGLYPDWKGPSEFDTFLAPEHITLDELIGAGKVLPANSSVLRAHSEDDVRGLAEDSFYIIRLTLHRKRWPWKWVTPFLYDYINSNWWYWTFGIIPISERGQEELQ
jgi:hypothetical protein